MKKIVSAIMLIAGIACVLKQKDFEKVVLPPKNVDGFSWEINNKERSAWSSKLIEVIKRDLEIYKKASDLKEICKSEKDDDIVRGLVEFWIGIAYFESSWDPTNYSVDVGNKDDNSTWSVGLFQLSEVDFKNYKLSIFYSFAELKNPINNIIFAEEIMKNQINKTGKIILDNSNKMRYWAVILRNNKYQKIDKIIERVKKYVPSCGL